MDSTRVGAGAHDALSSSMHGSRFLHAALSGLATLTFLGVASMLAGCTHVAPYERGTLAHPTMSSDDPFATNIDEHVRAISEGASGGLAGGGGGCGCN